jgi:SCP-2 sterol transfer family
MSDPIESFFDGLGRRGYEPLLQHTVGSIQFELLDGRTTEHWWVGIDRGRVKVRRGEAPAETVVKEERQTMVDTILGRRNVMSAFLRGEAGFTGPGESLVVFRRLFPDRAQVPIAQPSVTATTGR